MPKNSPTKVPGKAIASAGGKTGSLQHTKVADQMAAHNIGLMSGHSEGSSPCSPKHPGPNLESGVESSPAGNTQTGLGPIDVPGKGL